MLSAKPKIQTDGAAPTFFGVRLALAFAAAFGTTGIMLPYFPIWLKSLSLSDAAIGTVLSVPMIVRVVTTPVIASAADRAGDRAGVLFALSLAGFAATGLFYLAADFLSVLLIVMVQAFFVAPFVPLTDAITLTSVRRHGADYGRIRMWGSVAFIVSNILGGLLIARSGGGVVLPMLLVGNAAMVVAALAAPRFGRPRHASPLSGASLPTAGSIFRQPDFLLILGGCALIQASHAMLYAFSAIYWAGLGISGTVIGLLWATGVVGEVLLFQFSGPLLDRIGVVRLIACGGGVAVLRWLIFPFGLGTEGFFILQLCHAGSFAATHIGLQRVIAERVDETRAASAQGMMFCLMNAAMGVATLLSGYLFAWWGADAFVAMAGVALAGLTLAMTGFLRRSNKCR